MNKPSPYIKPVVIVITITFLTIININKHPEKIVFYILLGVFCSIVTLLIPRISQIFKKKG